MLTNENWSLMQAIWSRRLKSALVTARADREETETNIRNLYRVLDRPPPEICWYEGSRALGRTEGGVPLRHIHDILLYNLWFKIPEIERVLAMMGYDPTTNAFRIASNKTIIYQFQVKRNHRGQFPTRPPWSRDLSNMLSQFEAPYLALFDFAVEAKIPMEPNFIIVANAVKAVLDSTFAALLFERWVLVINRPLSIGLDATQMISSTSGPAFEPDVGETIFAVNGVVIPHQTIRRPSWLELNQGMDNPRQRIAVIEYMGWEKFFALVPRGSKTILDTDPKFGDLWEIRCGTQEITVVVVTNSTPEPDGSRKKYVIPVDHDCRPLPNPADPLGVLGPPQEQTALNAVASTFGMIGAHYKAILGTES